jgi:hypothetical protein
LRAQQQWRRAERERERLEDILVRSREAVKDYMREVGSIEVFQRAPILKRVVMANVDKITFEKIFKLYERLASEEDDLPLMKSGLAETYHDYGQLQDKNGMNAEAFRGFLNAVKNQREIVERFPNLPNAKPKLAEFFHSLSSQSTVAKCGLPVAGRPEKLFNSACEMSLCLPLLRAPSGAPIKLSDNDYETHVLRVLREAVDDGLNLQALSTSKALIPLRTRAEYRDLEQGIE